MSPYGKLLLTMCDNDLVVDLEQILSEHPALGFVGKLWLRSTALHLGLRIKGGS